MEVAEVVEIGEEVGGYIPRDQVEAAERVKVVNR